MECLSKISSIRCSVTFVGKVGRGASVPLPFYASYPFTSPKAFLHLVFSYFLISCSNAGRTQSEHLQLQMRATWCTDIIRSSA